MRSYIVDASFSTACLCGDRLSAIVTIVVQPAGTSCQADDSVTYCVSGQDDKQARDAGEVVSDLDAGGWEVSAGNLLNRLVLADAKLEVDAATAVEHRRSCFEEPANQIEPVAAACEGDARLVLADF